MTQSYQPKRIHLWRLVSASLRGVAALVKTLAKAWPLALIAVCFLSPISPHLRWSYTYTDVGSYRVYRDCAYLGVTGEIFPDYSETCPLIALIDRRTHRFVR
ncbi:MAG: hypothetical protein AAF515_16795 [Pseudomonadota bacterium]